MIAIQQRYEHPGGAALFATPIWNEDLFESHSRMLSLPVMHKLLVYMDQSLGELLRASADPAERTCVLGLLCKLTPLAAFLGYSALAEVAFSAAAAPAKAIPDMRDIQVAALTSQYVQNMLANLPAVLPDK